MILIDVNGACAVIRRQTVLTAGMVGAAAAFRFGEGWDGLTKTAVFRAGGVTRDVAGIGDTARIPHEVLTTPGASLEIGVYGASAEGDLVIPTVWVRTEPICAGADPSGDAGLEPELPVWQQAINRIDQIDLDNQAAIREAQAAAETANTAADIAYAAAERAEAASGTQNIQPIYSMEVTDEAGVAGIKIPFADYDENGKITKVHKYKDLVAVITVPGGAVTTAVGLDIRYFTRMQYNGNILSDTSFADLSYSHVTRVPSGLRVYTSSLRTSVEWIGIDKGTLPKTIFHDSDHRWTSTNWYPARVLAKDGDISDYCRGIWILSASADKQTIPMGTKILIFGNEIQEVAQ